jgi:hypothetical protein
VLVGGARWEDSALDDGRYYGRWRIKTRDKRRRKTDVAMYSMISQVSRILLGSQEGEGDAAALVLPKPNYVRFVRKNVNV